MRWKERHTVSDEKSLADDEIRRPQKARCCVGVTVNLSVAAGPDGIRAADLKTPEAEFAANQGLAVLKRCDLKATFAAPAVLAHIYAGQVRALVAQGHEIAAHGFKHEDVSGLERDDERGRMARATEIIAEVTGRGPEGWFSLPRQGDSFASWTISPNTMDLLIDARYGYVGNGLADDIPHYWVTNFASRRAILTLHYCHHFDDQFFLMFPRKCTGLEHPDALFENWKAECDAQYKRGRHFHMTLHPHHIGWCNRLQLLDDFLSYARGLPDLWNPTGTQCARYWLETYPASACLRLEPSIWRDYPGSLS
jgi:peptidoglycan/xylan/chitin deacetylase (PgdA/CDA1 family)